MGTNITYGSGYVETMTGIGFTVEAETSTMAMMFHGPEGSNAAFIELDKPGNGRGDTVTVNYMPVDPTQDFKGDNDNSVGEEQNTEELEEDEVRIRYMKVDRGVNNVVNAQNLVSWNVVERERTSMNRQVSHGIEQWHVLQLAGTTVYNAGGASPSTQNRRTWGNAGVAPDQAHWLRPDGVEVDGSTVTETTIAGSSANVLTEDTIRILEKRASTTHWVDYPFVPCDTPFGPLFVFWVGADGFDQLRDNSGTVYDLAKAAIQGGMEYMLHPSVTTGGFIIQNTLVLRHPDMPLGESAGAFRSNVERAVFFGGQALTCVYGEGYTDGDHWGYAEHQVLRKITMMADTIQGGKVAVVNGQRWASAVVSHYSTRTT